MNPSWRTHDFTIQSPSAAQGGLAQGLVELEWLLTNGTGAFAMGSVAGVNTRRYHGLFVAATHPPVGRIVALNQIHETLRLNPVGSGNGDSGRTVTLSSCIFCDPQGGEVSGSQAPIELYRFEKGLSVRWTYRIPLTTDNGQGGDSPDDNAPRLEYTRQLDLHWQQQAATLRYSLQAVGDSTDVVRNTSGGTVTLRPMVTLRDFHSLLSMPNAGSVSVQPRNEQTASLYRDDLCVTLQSQGAVFKPIQPSNDPWWYHIHYPIDAQRGQDHTEDYFVPGAFVVSFDSLKQPVEWTLTVALGEQPVDALAEEEVSDARISHLQPIVDHTSFLATYRRQTRRGKTSRSKKVESTPQEQAGDRAFKRVMVIAGDDFVTQRSVAGSTLATILAGYPWFADWGRDTFISLPGLLLCTGRFEEARSTLKVYAQSLHNGLVPNRFDDYDDKAAHYNAVDASLWFVHAAMQYRLLSGDEDSWNDWLCAAVMQVIDSYLRGTDHDIRMAGDGLISAGHLGTQLTWMDAARDGVVFTPRAGKTVEVNALWYHALVGMAGLLGKSNPSTAEHYTKLSKRVSRAFAKLFWNPDDKGLNDHIWVDEQGQEVTDSTLRPNQILAVSLPHSPLPRTKQQQVVDRVTQHLLTPYGLRTLPTDHPDYHGRYTGSMFDRDSAYHRGTVWPWLIGPYAEAVLRAGRFSEKSKKQALAAITPLLDYLMSRGLGQLHEIHDGDAPHRPVGCIAQAWSVAEVLRVLWLIDNSDAKR